MHPFPAARPFVIAVIFLLLGDAAILTYWDENSAEDLQTEVSRGECIDSLRPIVRTRKVSTGLCRQFFIDRRPKRNAHCSCGPARLHRILHYSPSSPILPRQIGFLGAVQFSFEAAMYIFVFLWTPMLDPHGSAEHPPLGFIFGSFMLAIMCGSWLFNTLLAKGWAVMSILNVTLLGAVASFTFTAIASNRFLLLCSFIVFEACCGIFFPGWSMWEEAGLRGSPRTPEVSPKDANPSLNCDPRLPSLRNSHGHASW
jgi:hypothetical protein